MAIEGRLEDASLADICQLLAIGRKTGCLMVTDRSNFGYIYFEKGSVIYAMVLNRPDRLGDMLVRGGVVTEDQLAQAMAEQAKQPERRIGQILVDQMGLTQDQVQRFVRVQIEEAVYHLFAWEAGSFRFEPDQRPEADEVLLVSLSAEGLLLEGARRVDEWTQIETKVPSMELVFQVDEESGDPDPDQKLTSQQEAVLPLLDGRRTVQDVVLDSGLVEFEVAKAIYGLAQAGLVNALETVGAGTAPGLTLDAARHAELASAFYRAGMLEEAEIEYRTVLEIDPERSQARNRLGLIALRTGRPEEALGCFDVGGDADGADPRALQNRALAFEQLGRYEEALTSLLQAAESLPDDPRITLAHSIVLLKAGRAAEALDMFERCRQLAGAEGRMDEAYYAYAILAAAAAGRLDEAMRIGQAGMDAFPSSSPILVNLGAVLEHRGESDAAEALYLRAVQLSEPPPQAHRNLGDLAHAGGDAAGAKTHYARAVKLDPVLGDETYRKLGDLAHAHGEPAEAREYWERALELNPKNKVAREKLSLVTKGSGS